MFLGSQGRVESPRPVQNDQQLSSGTAATFTKPSMKPIRIPAVQLPKLPSIPNSIGRPTITSALDRRFATGWGRTLAQQTADAIKRRGF